MLPARTKQPITEVQGHKPASVRRSEEVPESKYRYGERHSVGAFVVPAFQSLRYFGKEDDLSIHG